MKTGYVKLYRRLIKSDLWLNGSEKQKIVIITCLLLANSKKAVVTYKNKKFDVLPGQFITSLDSLSQKTGLTVQNVRTVLKKLEGEIFLTNKSTKHSRIITICNWSRYQCTSNDQSTKKLTTNKKYIYNKGQKSASIVAGDEGEKAWQKLLAKIRKGQSGHYFSDKKINKSIEEMGSWVNVATWTESQLVFKKREFLKYYNSMEV
ncbi:hypothetical protein GMMP15_2050005 [Candidatus Magnetomoraceae bacterium gMMP-15]